MLLKKLFTGVMACGMLIGGSSFACRAEDFMAQAQEMYDDAYAQAQEMYDDAYAQAQEMYDDAYAQAQEEVNEALGTSGTGDKKAPITEKIKNYVGRNAASFGYYSLGGDRLDDGYGGTLDTLKLILVSDDGTYIDISDDKVLKQYVVVAQNIEPDSDITFTYGDNGFCEHQTYSEIELLCKKVSGETENPVLTELTMANPSPDKTTQYIKDYVGRNLATVGYAGLDGNWHDEYNGTFNTVDLVIITDDGTYIEPDDKETQKQYVVTSQSPEANTEEIFQYSDYGFVESQTYSEIEIYVSKVE